MGAGRIIVAHGFPTINEVLQHNKNAIICKPDSINDLIDKVGMALNMTYPNEMATCAKNEVFEKYTWIKRVEKIFQNVNLSIGIKRTEI
jgi:glycosyltransferase involved in cell wall biosynthesis